MFFVKHPGKAFKRRVRLGELSAYRRFQMQLHVDGTTTECPFKRDVNCSLAEVQLYLSYLESESDLSAVNL